MSHTRQFRIELGINRNAAPIRQSGFYPLQNTPIFMQNSNQPYAAWWTRFLPGDELKFRLVDITDLNNPTYTEFSKELDLVCTDPNTGQSVNPFTETPDSWTFPTRVEWQPSPVFSPNRSLPTWDICPVDSDREQVILIIRENSPYPRRYEFSGELATVIGGKPRTYVFDPEVIISDTGGSSDTGYTGGG